MADAVVIRHLERLLSPRLVEDFRRGVVPDKAAATHDTLERLPEVLRQPQLASFAALSRAYRGPVAFGRGLRFPQVFDAGANAANLRQLGLTVYLRDIAPYAAGGHTFLRELETELGIAQGSARLTAFSSPHDDGVACHYDAEEVISVQMEGSKTFYVAPMAEIPQPYGSQFGPRMAASEDMYAQTREAFPDASRATFDAIRMTPGSVLFLPRGTWHRTEATEDSYSISIVLRPPTLLETLQQQLQGLLLQESAWRAPLYGSRDAHAGSAATRETAARLLAELPDSLACLRATDLMPRSIDERVASIDQTSRFRRIPTSRAETKPLSRIAMKLTVSAWDSDWVTRTTLETDAPALLEPVIRWLAASESEFSLKNVEREFPSHRSADLCQLLGLLVHAQYLRFLDFPAA
jgi:Cupin superfamily protein